MSVLAKAQQPHLLQKPFSSTAHVPQVQLRTGGGLRRPHIHLPLDRPLGKACLARLSWLCHWTLEGPAGSSWLSLGPDLCTNLPCMTWGSC